MKTEIILEQQDFDMIEDKLHTYFLTDLTKIRNLIFDLSVQRKKYFHKSISITEDIKVVIKYNNVNYKLIMTAIFFENICIFSDHAEIPKVQELFNIELEKYKLEQEQITDLSRFRSSLIGQEE